VYGVGKKERVKRRYNTDPFRLLSEYTGTGGRYAGNLLGVTSSKYVDVEMLFKDFSSLRDNQTVKDGHTVKGPASRNWRQSNG
jgi:hypothetical protein